MTKKEYKEIAILIHNLRKIPPKYDDNYLIYETDLIESLVSYFQKFKNFSMKDFIFAWTDGR